ncbi:MAG: glycosyltransferase, partial [Clostridia bacterium]|nr:glycosyltransferase [Clostridia bacterium]
MKKFYLVGNAHLDPVWQWQWQEGSAEAKATIRSALDRMKEFPEFRFVCSSASVYQWVEEFAPEMFEEIQQRYKEADIYVLPSLRETTGTALLEAMANKLPVVSLNQNGAKLVVTEDSGILVNVNSK